MNRGFLSVVLAICVLSSVAATPTLVEICGDVSDYADPQDYFACADKYCLDYGVVGDEHSIGAKNAKQQDDEAATEMYKAIHDSNAATPSCNSFNVSIFTSHSENMDIM
ncbi:hypothetical protein Fcan01_25594 [Folsomia candida]|uniref:Uncharacterized protein n=1 Tax=Folsomia candida TaxID=158441 RepID=A0A226D4E6_FOLCA|nr:hypothetical protein Fcan01_25594 [Folsomia candida]